MHWIQERQRLWRAISILAIVALSFSLLVVCEKEEEAAVIVEMVETLANVQTQEEAETAIYDLIDQVGLGTPGTTYEEYELSGEQVSEFAQFLVAFVAGEFTLNMGQVFAQVEVQGALVDIGADLKVALATLSIVYQALKLLGVKPKVSAGAQAVGGAIAGDVG